jgi:hypothetical protein
MVVGQQPLGLDRELAAVVADIFADCALATVDVDGMIDALAVEYPGEPNHDPRAREGRIVTGGIKSRTPLPSDHVPS